MVPAYFKPYFTPSEFDSPDLPGSGIRMNAMFISMLNKARSIAGIPFYINSGYRTPAHNKKVGGVPGSAHTKGLAADIAVTPATYGKVLSALIKAGFKRIGLGQNFIHVDIDCSKPCPAVWNYNGAMEESMALVRKILEPEMLKKKAA